MKKIVTITSLFLAILSVSCTKEYDCIDQQIPIAFISYLPSDIDTFVIRKFKSNDNFQTLLDTVAVNDRYGGGSYKVFNDTTVVFVLLSDAIKAGFDWQVFIPAKGKTVAISQINSEKRTEKLGWEIFSLDRADCLNKIYSYKVDNQVIAFSNSNPAENYICIKN